MTWTYNPAPSNILFPFTVRGGEARGNCVVALTISEEDARLIAAAPDLFAAAQVLLAWWDGEGRKLPLDRTMMTAIEPARSAITKATAP